MYLGIYAFQVSILDMSPHSGLTTDPIILNATDNPYTAAIIISAVVMVASYAVNSLAQLFKKKKLRRKNKVGSLYSNLGAVFRQRSVSSVQTVALALICFGTMLGYIYCTSNGKTTGDYMRYTDVAYAVKDFYCGTNDAFEMSEDGISEYYSCGLPNVSGVDSYGTMTECLFFADSSYSLGIDDETTEKLGDMTATGLLKQTFLIGDEESAFQDMIIFSEQAEKDLIIELSADEYKSFFNEGELGTKNLYRIETKLADTNTIEALLPYVNSGEINIENINNGSEIIAVFKRPMNDFMVGDTVELGSIMSNNGFGIGDVVTNEVKIGAIVVLPTGEDKMLSYAARNEAGYNLLTTVTGARALGLHNAAYNEVFAQEEIDGGLIPTSAGMTLTSYSQLKHERFLEKATEYGGVFLVIAIMSLLGFTAYFNGISLKIRTKSYQISVLRSVGTPISRIRKRMLFDGLKIPLIATVLAGAMTKAVQSFMLNKYEEIRSLEKPDSSGNFSLNEEQLDEIARLVDKYFVNNKVWAVPVEKPLLIIFAIMCAVTILLTFIALAKFKGNIADTLNSGRERQ